LPPGRQGDWTTEGWLKGTEPGRIQRHRQGRRVQEKLGLPVLKNVESLRELLGIKSPSQLGWFLVASDEGEGPYTRYTIPKRDGTQREICAPKPQLRWTQKQILRQILDRVPAHQSAHGFIPGRSTVTNAGQHQGSELLVKFDLVDFFPTIHYF